MEEPQPLTSIPMETEIPESTPQSISESHPQVETEPPRSDKLPNEPNISDNIMHEIDSIQVEPIQEESNPEAMETETESPKELIQLTEEVAIIAKEYILSNKTTDKKRETLELAQLELVATLDTIIPNEMPDDAKEKEVRVSQDDDNMDTDEAIRELDELFNSGEDTTKDPITPPKELGEAETEEKENSINIKTGIENHLKTKDFESLPSTSRKGKETPVSENDDEKKIKKKGGKKLTKLRESQSPIESEENLDPRGPLFELNSEKKFKLPNKGLSIHQLRERYNDIIYHFRCEGEVACLVCLDDEAIPEDDIIICDLCSSAFHQSCYGSDLLNIAADDDSEWHCQRCAHLLKNNLPAEAIPCMFCPELKGPIKRVRSNNASEWAHIVCVNWIPEIYYSDLDINDNRKANVHIADYKTNRHCGRKNLNCTFCKLRYGDCIQCDTEKCPTPFHVTCAQKHGLICNWKEMKDMKRDEDTEYYTPIYCKHHMQLYSEEMFEFSNKVEAKNKSRGLEVSLLLDSATIMKTQSVTKRSHKAKKRVKEKEIEKFVEKEYESETEETNKRRSLRSRKQIEDDRKSEEERQAFKTRGRTAKKSVLPLPLDEEEFSYQMEETHEENIHKFDEEAHFGEKPRKEHSGSKKEIDSSFISPRHVLTHMEEEEPVKRTPDKSTKQTKAKVTEKKGKTEKKKREKTEHAEKINKRERPDKTAKEEKAEKKESSEVVLYKFRPNMAKLLRFNGWGTEKEMKTAISDYIKEKGLYRKDDEEIDIAKDPVLEEIIGLERIPRKQIFTEFLHFMLKKSPEEVVRGDNNNSFFAQYEEEYKKEKAREKDLHEKENRMTDEDKQGERRIKKKAGFPDTVRREPVKEVAHPLAQSHPLKKANNPKTNNAASKPIERPFQQRFGKESMGWQPTTSNNTKPKPQEKESNLDFFEWTPTQNENKPSHHTNIVKPASQSQNIQKYNEDKEPPLLKRMKLDISPPKQSTTALSALFAHNKEDRQERQDLKDRQNHQDRPDRLDPSDHHDRPERHVHHEHYHAPPPTVLAKPKNNDAFEGLGPIISKADKMPFRRTMNWFVKTDTSLTVSSINSQASRERFWPKGAELLF